MAGSLFFHPGDGMKLLTDTQIPVIHHLPDEAIICSGVGMRTKEETIALHREYTALVQSDPTSPRCEELRQQIDADTSAWWDSMTPDEQEEARASAREAVLSYMRKRRQR
jgi:hypothetical protein